MGSGGRRRGHPAGLLLLAIRAPGPTAISKSLVRRLHGVPLPPGLGKRKLLLDYPMSGLPAPNRRRRRHRAAGRAASARRATSVTSGRWSAHELPRRASVAPGRRRLRRVAADGASGCAAAGGRAAGLRTARGRRERHGGQPRDGRSAVGARPRISIRGCASRPDSAAKSSGRTRTATSKRPGGRSATCSAANGLRRRAEFSLAASADAPPEVDLADPGRRPRHLDRARSLAHLRQREPHDHRTASSVAAAAVDRLGRIPAGRRARAAACAGAAAWRAVGRSGGSGVAIGRRAALEGRGAPRHRSTCSTRRARCGESPRRRPFSRGSCPISTRPGMTAAQVATQLDSMSQLADVDFRHRRPGRGARGDRSTPTACSPQWACGRSAHLQPGSRTTPDRQ